MSNTSNASKNVKRFLLLFALGIAYGFMYVMPYMKSSFYDQMIAAMGCTNAQLGSLMTAYCICCTVSYLPGGWIGDKFNPKPVLLISIFGQAALSFLFMFTYKSYTMAVIIWLLMGLTGGFAFWPAIMKGIRMTGTDEEQGRMYGIFEALNGLASLLLSFIMIGVMSADYKIAIGTTMAHSYYGFSGGAKCILPGVSSLRTIMRNHSFTTTTEFNMGNPHTLMRSDAEQAARMMGLDFKIDAILNGHAQICNLFAGDFEAEIQHAAAYAAEHYAAKFVPDCDVVIANNYFKPAEANCAYTPEVIASLKDGGSFVLAANSPFGPCVHFLYDKWGHSAPGGMMWSGCYTKGKNMAHAVVFAEHTVKGMRDPWYIDEHSGAEYVKTWNDALRILDDGTPKKVVLYPNAECQVLDNSKQFYKQGK